jgi:Cu2+-exporting ATPase
MLTLVSLTIIVALVRPLAATSDLLDVEVWWELASLIKIMILGH